MAVASVYCPISYEPCPVTVFKEPLVEGATAARGPQGQLVPTVDKATTPQVQTRTLLALGSLLAVDPDRVVVKRIMLTGYPIRVHRRHATVRMMFFNSDDVRVRSGGGPSARARDRPHPMRRSGSSRWSSRPSTG